MGAYPTQTDQELMALLKAGNEMAYEIIFKRYWVVLYRHARKMLHDEHDAEDVIQEVFLQLWNKSDVLEIDASLSAYLYTTVRNKVFNKMNHEKVKTKYMALLGKFIEVGEAETDHLIRERQLKDLIEHEVAALPESMRIIFELSRNSQLSYQEIAEKLELTEGAVRNKMSRALKILRSKLGSTVVLLFVFSS